MTDITLIFNPLQAPNHEFDEKEIKTLQINVFIVYRRIFTELLEISDESYTMFGHY